MPVCLTPGGQLPLGAPWKFSGSNFFQTSPAVTNSTHTARINTLSSLQALLFGFGNLILFCQLDHMLQIPCKQDRKQNLNSGNVCEVHLNTTVKEKKRNCMLRLVLWLFLGTQRPQHRNQQAQASLLDGKRHMAQSLQQPPVPHQTRE